VTKDLLLIYNTNSPNSASSNVFAYYTNNRPMVSAANVLPIGCTNYELIDLATFTNTVLAPISNWLATNPTKRPHYLILFPDIPSRVWSSTNAGGVPLKSVQYGISTSIVGIQPFVTSINMGLFDTTNDCMA